MFVCFRFQCLKQCKVIYFDFFFCLLLLISQMKDLEWSASICYISQPRSPQGGELSVVLRCLIFCGRDENR